MYGHALHVYSSMCMHLLWDIILLSSRLYVIIFVFPRWLYISQYQSVSRLTSIAGLLINLNLSGTCHLIVLVVWAYTVVECLSIYKSAETWALYIHILVHFLSCVNLYIVREGVLVLVLEHCFCFLHINYA
jgi:hypothetical protein